MTVNQDAQKLIDKAEAAGHRTTAGYLNAKGQVRTPIGANWKDHDAALAAARKLLDPVAPPPPPPPTSTFGAALLAKWPAPPAPKNRVVVKTWADFAKAWTAPVADVFYEADPVFAKASVPMNGNSRDWINPGVKTGFVGYRGFAMIGGAGRLLTAGRGIILGDTMERPFEASESPEDGLKIDIGSYDIYFDGLITRNNGASGIQVGSESYAAVTRLRALNWLTQGNGQNDNKDHGMYLDHLAGFLIANLIADANQAYEIQAYTACHDGTIVNYTLNAGYTRGGVVVGTEDRTPPIPDPTANLRFVGGIITRVPSNVPAAHVNVSAPNCTFEDTVLWANGGGNIVGLPNARPVYADPLLDVSLKLAKGSSAKGIVQDVGWVYPTDIWGAPRVTADAGAVAVGS